MHKDLVKSISAILRCLQEYTSEDPTRSNLNTVHCALDGISLEATDGHRAIRVVVNDPNLWETVGEGTRLDAKKALALVKAGMLPTREKADFDFPELSRVFPRKEPSQVSNHCGFDSALLASSLDAIAKLGKALGLKQAGVKVQFPGEEHAPIRIDADFYGVSVIAVVMPMRL